jgi:hypothetical protein
MNSFSFATVRCLGMAVLLSFSSVLSGQAAEPSAAQRLVELINAYRAENGLHSIPVSSALTAVAEAHVKDLQENSREARCNAHSWSDRGRWTPCCYTEDHAQAKCMWDKPSELTQGRFRSPGYEISSWFSARMTPEAAIMGWKRSEGHDSVIRNRGRWGKHQWKSIGVAVSQNYAVAWFARDRDQN